jgi:hypothetical protein
VVQNWEVVSAAAAGFTRVTLPTVSQAHNDIASIAPVVSTVIASGSKRHRHRV